jgi:type VI protein secretion system component VasF
LRERLLARLPQPENVAAYREETASLLAKHERALSWDKWSYRIFLFCAVVLVMTAWSNWAQRLDPRAPGGFLNLAGLMFIAAVSTGLQYSFNRSKVDILKEVKQVQLQVLELQASLRKDGAQ